MHRPAFSTFVDNNWWNGGFFVCGLEPSFSLLSFWTFFPHLDNTCARPSRPNCLIEKLYHVGFFRFTHRNILRIYPKGTRITSSNYNPLLAWMHGAQMVAFNMQVHFPPLRKGNKSSIINWHLQLENLTTPMTGTWKITLADARDVQSQWRMWVCEETWFSFADWSSWWGLRSQSYTSC